MRKQGKQRVLMLLLMLMAIIAGCADTFSHKKVAQTLVKGSTTKQEVLAAFGKPNGKYTNPGMKMSSGGIEHHLSHPFDVWLYSPHESKVVDLIEEETLRIIFNHEGIVTNYEFNDDGD